MSLKLILISIDGTLVHNGKIKSDIARELGKLSNVLAASGVRTVLWSNRKWTINQSTPLAKYFSDLAGTEVFVHGHDIDGSPPRVTKASAAPIMERYGVSQFETLLIGGMPDDMKAAVNNGLLLIRPDWYAKQMNYGFPVTSVSELARFCCIFALRRHPIFWQIQSGNLHVSSAGPFSTQEQDYAVFGGDARAFAKSGLGHPDFWFYFTISSLYFSGLLQDIKYICSYPGHAPRSADADARGIAATLTRLGKCLGMSYYHDLIVRHTAAPKSQYTKARDRLLSNQVNTICLNRNPHRNLKPEPNKTKLDLRDKTVLIVDDFCTSGRSSEAARLYIESGGGRARIYTWLKTIRSSYEQVADPIKLRPYDVNIIKTEPRTVSHSYQDGIIDSMAPEEIQSIFEKYAAWKW